MQILEAFKALQALDEDIFDISAEGVKELSNFMDSDDIEDEVQVIDPEAEFEDELQDSYVGKVILDCCVCHSKLYKNKEDVVIDSEAQLANVGEDCPYCFTPDGFKVIGEVVAFGGAEESQEEENPEITDESLNEGILDKFKKKKQETPAEEPKQEEPKEEEPKKEHGFETYSYDDWIQALEYGHKYYAEDGPAAGKMKLWSKALEIAASENLARDVIACMNDWMKHDGSKNFPHKSYAKHLKEAAFSGGMAGDNSASGGTVRGIGASTQPGKNNYLNRMKSKNPDLVDTMVIKVSEIKPGMITQAGQVKEAEARDHVSGSKKMYIMHTNGYDGFWGLDETMDVMVDPENKSKPFAGDYRSLLKMGLQESNAADRDCEVIDEGIFDKLKKKKKPDFYSKEEIEKRRKANEDRLQKEKEKKEEEERKRRAEIAADWARRDKMKRDAERDYQRSRSSSIKGDSPSNTGYRGVSYSGGDYYSESLDPINENINNLSLDTDDTHMEMTSDESGKVTVITEPITSGADSNEMIAPISDETETEIMDNSTEDESADASQEEIDVEVDELDDESMNELGEAYLKRVYENVQNYKVTGVKTHGNNLIIEGNIKFSNNNIRKSNFIFEAYSTDGKGKVTFKGRNEITGPKNAFTLTGTLKDNSLKLESLTYNYRTLTEGKSNRVYGQIRI